MDWPTFIEKVGYPVVVTAVLAWGLWKFATVYIWPLIKESVEQARADKEKQIEQARLDKEQERNDRLQERDLFLASLENIVKTNKENNQKTVNALNTLTKAVNLKRTMQRKEE